MLPSRAYLLALLRYDPATGRLTWRPRAAASAHDRAWNTRYADKPAFTAKDDGGYLCGRIHGKTYRAHRIVWKMETGEEPQQVDHKNGRRDDLRWRNLRAVNPSGNAQNAGVRADNTSGVPGVVFDRDRLKWRAQIHVEGKCRYLGLFSSIENAAEARRAAEKKHGFFPAHGKRKGYSPS